MEKCADGSTDPRRWAMRRCGEGDAAEPAVAGGGSASVCDVVECPFPGVLSGSVLGVLPELRSECAGCFRATIQNQFLAELQLTRHNPTMRVIRNDFERFGFVLNFPASVAQDITYLDHLNHWRNTSAHARTDPPPISIPQVLVLTDLQRWRTACNALAGALDDIMYAELQRILGTPPW